MAGRGATTFQKRQKEQLRKEKREAKLARRHNRKNEGNVQSPELAPPEHETEFENRSDEDTPTSAESRDNLA